MDIKFIFNVIIVVLILHFILENIDVKIEIGKPTETFSQRLSPEESMKFLTSETTEEFSAAQDLLDYINNNSRDIRGKDFYKTDYNTPHFNSNLTDVHSFYNINSDTNNCTNFGFDGVNLNEMMNNNPETKENYENPTHSNQNRDVPGASPEQWHYNNEMPMNGGLQEGVVGYSKIEDDFAPFPNQNNILKENDFQKCTGETNDLRYVRQNYEA